MLGTFIRLMVGMLLFSFVRAEESALIDALKRGDTGSVAALVAQAADVNAFDEQGNTGLHWAANTANIEALKALLAVKGIQINAINANGQTPFDVAKNEEVDELLSARGAQSFAPVWRQLLTFFDAINEGDGATIDAAVKKPELADAIKKIVDGGIKYHFALNKDTIAFDGPHKVTVDGSFKASKQTGSTSWSIDGFSTKYTLEKQGDQWVITDTDFTSKLSKHYFWGFLLGIFLLLGLVVGFWLWMLVDCIGHPVKYKALWIIFLLFFNVFAAIIYYFAVKRRRSVTL